ncbi:cytochrome c oxidase subunit 7A-related protein, mitochondrial-like [Anastrepha obliqua]|uniref:cytochrome c oxidase subunit 7A-related protein, mitochondrial-like n=1 Tax=Anastrepha obliqua TaxID=95512 RepID=UPI0024099835|nr:cytochrome c oxidase subunit 7A-related protein, mitochondrial-like [Anastrepha obliqua]
MFGLIRPTFSRDRCRSLFAMAVRLTASATSGTSKGSGSCGPSAGPSKKPNPGLEKIRKMQEHFQKDNGKPIHLKGGSKDLMLYRATWALALLGLLLQIHLFAMYIIY